MSKGRSYSATKFHDGLSAALVGVPSQERDRIIKAREIVDIYEKCHGKLSEKEKNNLKASDHCDSTTSRAKKGTGRCSICEAGEFLLLRVSDSGSYRLATTLFSAPAASSVPNEADPSREYSEGGPSLQHHRLSERRSRQLIADKKAQVLQSLGKLACEVCHFDFAEIYGTVGNGFAEGHHTKPMAQDKGVRISRLEDIAIVCANCHRMLHRPPYHPIDGLRAEFEFRRCKRASHEAGF